MKSLTTQLALSLTLVLGSLSNAFAADIDYYQTGPIFTESAYLIGGIGEIDTFYFTNSVAGTYHFYSYGTGDGISTYDTDTYGYIYSDTYATTLYSNDDAGPGLGFCVEAYLLAGEAITIYVEGWAASSEGAYTVYGNAGSCSTSGYYPTDSNVAAPISGSANSATSDDSGAFSLPAILFTILGLGAVRLRRLFA